MSTFEPPAENWAGGRPRPRSAPNAAVMMIVGAGLLGTGCLGGLICGWIAGTTNNFGDIIDAAMVPPKATLTVTVPEKITAGNPFDLTVVVQNDGDEATTIGTIDLHGAVCDQFELVSIDPTPSRSSAAYGWHEYTYDMPLPRNGRQSFVFSLKAKTPGTYDGDVAAFMGMTYQEISKPLTVVVDGGE